MGQKAKGYRREAIYGKGTARRGTRDQWMLRVNPPSQSGWSKMGSGRTSHSYGKSEGVGDGRRTRVAQVRRASEYEVGVRGRSGDSATGYKIIGEYVCLGDSSFPRSERERLTRGFSIRLGVGVELERVDRGQRVVDLGLRSERRRRTRRGGTEIALEQARAVVIVLGGILRRESLLGVRAVRYREASGLAHKKARRVLRGILLAHAIQSDFGLASRLRSGGGGYYGYRLSITGPLGGSRRTGTQLVALGQVPQSIKRGLFGEWEGVARTSVGTLGVRVVYAYGLG